MEKRQLIAYLQSIVQLETSIYEQEQALEQLKQQRDYLASYDNIGEMAITISYSP